MCIVHFNYGLLAIFDDCLSELKISEVLVQFLFTFCQFYFKLLFAIHFLLKLALQSFHFRFKGVRDRLNALMFMRNLKLFSDRPITFF